MGFVIERKLSAGDYNPIAVVGANVTTYSDKLLSAATMYCYRVRAYNTAGDSSDSNESCATTTVGADNAPPSLTTPPLSPADELATRLASVELHTDDLKREIQRLAVLVEVLETSLSSVQKLDTRLTGISADIDIVEQKVEALDRRVQTAEVVVQAQKVSSNAWLTVSVVLAGLAMLVALTTWLLAVGH